MTAAHPASIGLASPADVFGALLARRWWAIAVRGALAIVFGLIALFYPTATILSLALVFAAYCLLDGIMAVVAAFRPGGHAVALVLEGVVDLAAAAFTVLWPGMTAVVFVFLLGGWAIVSGVMAIVGAARLQADHGRVWLGLGGVVSVLYGVLLFIGPLIGLLVLTWWLGAYALVFGVALLALALRLKAKQTPALR